VPTKNPDPYPPDLTNYLKSIATKAGAETTWQETNEDVYSNFAATGEAPIAFLTREQVVYLFTRLLSGDWMRNSRPDLETVINAGVSSAREPVYP